MSHEGLTLTHSLTSALMEGRLTDPFVFLGPHEAEGNTVVRTFQPGAVAVSALQDGAAPSPLEEVAPGLFAGRLTGKGRYRLSIDWGSATQETEDPYAFDLLLGDLDLHLFMEGAHWELGQKMGAQPQTLEGVEGVGFSVWAPMRAGFRWSAISTAGTAAATPCACAIRPGCGNCSYPAWARGSATSTSWSGQVANSCR